MERLPFQPHVFFDQNKTAITVANDSNDFANVAVTTGGGSRLGPFVLVLPGASAVFERTDFETVAVSTDAAPSTGSLAAVFHTAPGSLVRFGGAGAPAELPLGLEVTAAPSSRKNTLRVANQSREPINVRVSERFRSTRAWLAVPSGTAAEFARDAAECATVQYFDAARVGALVRVGETLVVHDHNPAWVPYSPRPIATPTTVSFLSFNVRFGNAPDGLNSWHYRRYLHREVYATRLPTVFGLQEALLFQRQQIAASFPWYQSVGVGREPNFGGEATPLFYDARVYMLKFTETYWLSETPNVPGSVTKSWGNHLPRIATMAHLIPNQSVTLTNGNFPTTVVVNVHLDHEAPLARFKSAQLVCRRTLAYMKDQNLNPETTLVVILGDFNNLEFGSPENRTIETEGNLYDALSSHGLQGTFHGFTGVVEPTRIDYIYISKNWKERITKTEIIQDTAGSGSTSGEWWPSDHLPVFVELSLGSSPPQSEKSMTSCLSASYPALARRTRYLLPLFGILITLIVFAAVTCQGI